MVDPDQLADLLHKLRVLAMQTQQHGELARLDELPPSYGMACSAAMTMP